MTNPPQGVSGSTATETRNSSDSQGRPSPHRHLLKWALDSARRDLVDLSRRNRLLHAPLGGKRPWCMAIVGHSPDELFDKLYRQENFRGYAFSARDGSDEEQAQSNALALQLSRRSQLRHGGHDFRRGSPLTSLKGVLQRFFAKSER